VVDWNFTLLWVYPTPPFSKVEEPTIPFSPQSESRYMHIIKNTWNLLKRSEMLPQTSEEKGLRKLKDKVSPVLN
jgi:hypothetical protein